MFFSKLHLAILKKTTAPLTQSFIGCKELSSVSGNMKPFDLYGFGLSQPTRSILFLCDENKIPYNFISVDARKLEARKPEFLKQFPVGLVPAINDEGFLLTEAAAILQYLCEKHQLSSWYPLEKDKLKLRGNINFWMHWHHSNIRLSTTKILIPNYYPPKGVSKEEAVAKGAKEFTRRMKFLDAHLKKRIESVQSAGDASKVFLCTENHPTIADLFVLPELDQLSKKGFDLFDFSPYPFVQQWMELCQRQLSTYEHNIALVQSEAKHWTGFLPKVVK